MLYRLGEIADMHAKQCYFFCNDTATTEIYTLSLHDALPISSFDGDDSFANVGIEIWRRFRLIIDYPHDRLYLLRSEEHTSELQYVEISYAVFCLKKKSTRNRVKLLDSSGQILYPSSFGLSIS